MKILIVSGFLGAGKTTFIKAMAKATGREFVIVENEFSEENIDGKILQKDIGGNQMQIVELSEGCICCSLNLDFSYSVLTIANTLNPDYLVVEPSGVAQTSNILNDLERIVYERITLLAPITLVDTNNFMLQSRDFKNYFDDQLITAGTVVLSKSENLGEDSFLEIKESLKIADDVYFPLKHYENWSLEEWQKLFEKELSGEDFTKIGQRFIERKIKREANQDLESVAIDQVRFLNPDQCYNFLEEVLDDKYGIVIRAKGFAKIKDEFIHIELVDKAFSMTGLSEEEVEAITEDLQSKDSPELTEVSLGKLVFIGKKIKRELLKDNISV